MKANANSNIGGNVEEDSAHWAFSLYVAGKTAKSLAAFSNLKQICEANLKGKYSIEIVDLMENPSLAKQHQIVAVPAVVRKLPPPVKKLIGSLAEKERVMIGLELRNPEFSQPTVTK